MKTATFTSIKKAKSIAGFASDKKAEDIVVLDMRKVVNFCDYFVVCSATSDRHLKGVLDGIQEGLHQIGLKTPQSQGLRNASLWGLLDLGDVVIHVFERTAREFYGLDYLWQDAKKVAWQK